MSNLRNTSTIVSATAADVCRMGASFIIIIIIKNVTCVYKCRNKTHSMKELLTLALCDHAVPLPSLAKDKGEYITNSNIGIRGGSRNLR